MKPPFYRVSKLVETFSGVRIPANKPVVGENVFTQTAGIHADGDKKNKLYFSDLMPERFGRQRKYALGKTSGKANIENNLASAGHTAVRLRPQAGDRAGHRTGRPQGSWLPRPTCLISFPIFWTARRYRKR
ncbi:homocitrate synthase/isopropylmalate synthase family protein [Puia sp. P3]|uniref:homocitrate synthase/isopropylmalate synthase family protein n=1 Tax=Puia sp. P3 TaxID=3423952 RepID=UPI003D66BE27